ncbi:unnamed protein product [Closterium sp. NIES-53]
MIHAAAPHFLWPFAVQYAAHQLNLWPRVSLPETSPTLRWTGKVGDASVFRFYHPTLRRVLPSQDVTFDESVPFYRLFPYRSAPPPPPPLFLAPGPPAVDPLPPQGPAPSGVSQVDPLPGTAPVQVAVVSGAASGGAASGGAELVGAGSEGAGFGGAELEGVEPRGAESEGAESGGAAGASPRLSSQQLREWLVQRAHRRSGAPECTLSFVLGTFKPIVTITAGGPGDTGAGGAAVTTGAGDPTKPGAAGAGGDGAGVAGVGGSGAGGAGAAGPGVGGTSAGGAGAAGAEAVDPGAGGAAGTVRPRPYFSQPPLQPASPVPVPSPYTEQSGGLTEHREPASCFVSPVCTTRRAPRLRPPPVLGTHTMALPCAASPTVARHLSTAVTDPSFESGVASALVAELLDFAAACRLDYASALVAESVPSSPPSVRGECAVRTDVLEDRQEEFECLAAAVPRFASLLLAPEGDPDAPDIPTPRSYTEAIEGPYSSQVKQPPGSPPAFKARYVARGFSQKQGVDDFQTFSPTPKMTTLWVLMHVAAQHDYELHSLDFSTTFLQGSLHEEIWLRRPPGFTGTTTLAALGFVPSTEDPSLFLRTDTSLPSFYVLVYVNDLVFATTDTEALTLVKSELQKRHTCTDLGPSALRLPVLLAIAHSSVYHPLALSSTFGRVPRYVAPGRHRKVHWDAAKRVLRYLSSTSGMGLMLGGWVPVVLTGHADASWVDDSATQRSSQGYTFSLGCGSISWRSTRSSSVLSFSCEAEIYAGAMAAQELHWLTYLLTDLGEQPHLPPVLYVDNKAMIALCQEHRLEHRMKHIALRYFLARELQQRGLLRLAYVATRANTADVFTKALPPGDHRRFVTVLGLWLTHDATARLAIRNHVPLAERAHFGQHKTAKALFDAVVARYSSPATAALGRLILPYPFPELSAFATVDNLITHLRNNDTHYRTALKAKFLDKNPPPMYITLYFIVTHLPDSLSAVKDLFLAMDPTDLMLK